MDWTRTRSRVEALLAAQKGLLVSFSWGDGEQTFSGVRTNLKREEVATDEGLWAGGYQYSLVCPLSQFPDGVFPAARKGVITVGGIRYRVLSTDVDSIQASVRLNLGEYTA